MTIYRKIAIIMLLTLTGITHSNAKAAPNKKSDDANVKTNTQNPKKKRNKNRGNANKKSTKSKKSSTVIQRERGDVNVKAILKRLYGNKGKKQDKKKPKKKTAKPSE